MGLKFLVAEAKKEAPKARDSSLMAVYTLSPMEHPLA
jgi:hypothetical protein